MATKIDEMLPSAGDFMKKLALAEAEEASKQAAKLAEAEAEKDALLDHYRKPSGVSDEEGIRRAIKIIERAVSNGRTEVQVTRFPNVLCTDKGRAIIAASGHPILTADTLAEAADLVVAAARSNRPIQPVPVG